MEESASVPIEKVAFEREWTFWENYETKEHRLVCITKINFYV